MHKSFETIGTVFNRLKLNPTLLQSREGLNLGSTYDQELTDERMAVSGLGYIVLPVTVPTLADCEFRTGRSSLPSPCRTIGAQLTSKTILALLQ